MHQQQQPSSSTETVAVATTTSSAWQELDRRQRKRRLEIHRELFVPEFAAKFLRACTEISIFSTPTISQYFSLPLLSASTGRIVLYSPFCIVTNMHLSHKKKDAGTVRPRLDPSTARPKQLEEELLNPLPPLPSFAQQEEDCTMFVLTPNDLSSTLFDKMPEVIEELDRQVDALGRPDLFSRTTVCWNKKKCPNMTVYNAKNILDGDLHCPVVPRSLFLSPPAAVMDAVARSLFVGGLTPPPLLHWAIYNMKEGKLFGLNFDWQECYMGPATASAAAAASAAGHSLLVEEDEEDDDTVVQQEGEEEEEEETPPAVSFRKLSDAKYAVVMMLSNYRRVIKFYFHPSLVPATADPTRKKRICSTVRFEMTNGQFLVIPQETKVCVTASQVSNEIFSGKKQKKDFPKTFYFCVLFYGPRV